MKGLSSVEQKFVLHWGEMGTRWGINRTVAQVHALLYIARQPMNAEQIVESLGVARSNVSTSLKELQGWGIVRLVHVADDKRDHFGSMTDPWEMFRVVLDERKRREIDPTLKLLRECLAEARSDPATGRHTQERLQALLNFFESTTAWYDQLRRLPAATLIRFIKLGDKTLKLLK